MIKYMVYLNALTYHTTTEERREEHEKEKEMHKSGPSKSGRGCRGITSMLKRGKAKSASDTRDSILREDSRRSLKGLVRGSVAQGRARGLPHSSTNARQMGNQHPNGNKKIMLLLGSQEVDVGGARAATCTPRAAGALITPSPPASPPGTPGPRQSQSSLEGFDSASLLFDFDRPDCASAAASFQQQLPLPGTPGPRQSQCSLEGFDSASLMFDADRPDCASGPASFQQQSPLAPATLGAPSAPQRRSSGTRPRTSHRRASAREIQPAVPPAPTASPAAIMRLRRASQTAFLPSEPQALETVALRRVQAGVTPSAQEQHAWPSLRPVPQASLAAVDTEETTVAAVAPPLYPPTSIASSDLEDAEEGASTHRTSSITYLALSGSLSSASSGKCPQTKPSEASGMCDDDERDGSSSARRQSAVYLALAERGRLSSTAATSSSSVRAPASSLHARPSASASSSSGEDESPARWSSSDGGYGGGASSSCSPRDADAVYLALAQPSAKAMGKRASRVNEQATLVTQRQSQMMEVAPMAAPAADVPVGIQSPAEVMRNRRNSRVSNLSDLPQKSAEPSMTTDEPRASAVPVDAAAARRSMRRRLLKLEMPYEFFCPITQDTMRDPVVASDGRSYERSALEAVLAQSNPLSPLTREPLDPKIIIPNFNLRKRIEDYKEDMLNAAEFALQEGVDERSSSGAEEEEARRPSQLEQLPTSTTSPAAIMRFRRSSLGGQPQKEEQAGEEAEVQAGADHRFIERVVRMHEPTDTDDKDDDLLKQQTASTAYSSSGGQHGDAQSEDEAKSEEEEETAVSRLRRCRRCLQSIAATRRLMRERRERFGEFAISVYEHPFMEASRVMARLKYLTKRFDDHAPRWQYMIWARYV